MVAAPTIDVLKMCDKKAPSTPIDPLTPIGDRPPAPRMAGLAEFQRRRSSACRIMLRSNFGEGAGYWKSIFGVVVGRTSSKTIWSRSVAASEIILNCQENCVAGGFGSGA